MEHVKNFRVAPAKRGRSARLVHTGMGNDLGVSENRGA